jgi:hypothetical protein
LIIIRFLVTVGIIYLNLFYANLRVMVAKIRINSVLKQKNESLLALFQQIDAFF